MVRNDKVYLLLRPGEPLLDVDGQLPGGDPFPCLGHVAQVLPGAACGTSEEEEVAEQAGETLPWCVKPPPPRRRLGSLRVTLIPVTAF